MNPEVAKYIQDILNSIQLIEHHLATTTTFKEYASNYTVIDAVERRLMVIGEALWQATKLDQEFQ